MHTCFSQRKGAAASSYFPRKFEDGDEKEAAVILRNCAGLSGFPVN